MIWTIAALVAGLTWGFWLGRRFGEDEGRRRGLAEAPLELRERVLEGQGDRCPVCGGLVGETPEPPTAQPVLQWEQAGS
ncbi:MAG: hypothetical protein ACM3ZA_00185 [Bacillota bacterium]